MELISIIMATYNGEKYLHDQLDSIYRQTYQNFELIVIDDISTDSTRDIIYSWMEKDNLSRIRIYVNRKRLGPTKAFEKGVLLSKGDYIAICDQDDIWFENKLEELLSKTSSYGADFVYSPSIVIKENVVTSKMYPKSQMNKTCFDMLWRNEARGATMLMRKEFLLKILPFSNYGLYDKWIYFLGSIYGKGVRINVPLQYYRIHDKNLVGNKFNFSKRDIVIQKLILSKSFYLDLRKYILSNERTMNNVDKNVQLIITHLSDAINCIKKRKLDCFMRYIENVLMREFSLKEKLIFFYYYNLK